ncbi:MAG: hypothetical protein NT130_00505 [Candidatus Micrarchaeota archaeon]|nr:hypothetical protein [Candidatus Micrarchaeota archaeon]
MEKIKLAFLVLFTILSLAAYQLKFSTILGVPSQNFNFFQFIGPIGAGIFTPILGVVSVLFVEALNFFISGKALDPITLVRFTPMMFAAYYFGSKSRNRVIVPLVCMGLFMLHPIGRQAWYYALYWLIPVAAAVWKDKLFLRSLGATFTAHAIGSVAFLYAFGIPADVWATLVPITAYERLFFAVGISISYIAVNTILNSISSRVDVRALRVDPRYVLFRENE